MPRAKAEKRSENGITFASLAELRRYQRLKQLRALGAVAWFIRQPTFDLAGAVYRPDFLVVYPSGEIKIEEVKPLNAPSDVITRWKRNYNQVLELYGLKVVLVQE